MPIVVSSKSPPCQCDIMTWARLTNKDRLVLVFQKSYQMKSRFLFFFSLMSFPNSERRRLLAFLDRTKLACLYSPKPSERNRERGANSTRKLPLFFPSFPLCVLFRAGATVQCVRRQKRGGGLDDGARFLFFLCCSVIGVT